MKTRKPRKIITEEMKLAIREMRLSGMGVKDTALANNVSENTVRACAGDIKVDNRYKRHRVIPNPERDAFVAVSLKFEDQKMNGIDT